MVANPGHPRQGPGHDFLLQRNVPIVNPRIGVLRIHQRSGERAEGKNEAPGGHASKLTGLLVVEASISSWLRSGNGVDFGL